MSLNRVMVPVRSMSNHQKRNDFPRYVIVFFLYEYSRAYQSNDTQAINNNQVFLKYFILFFR